MAAITTLVRRLVNAYKVKAGVVSLQCNNCVIHTSALRRRASHSGALYKASFLQLPFTVSIRIRGAVQFIVDECGRKAS